MLEECLYLWGANKHKQFYGSLQLYGGVLDIFYV